MSSPGAASFGDIFGCEALLPPTPVQPFSFPITRDHPMRILLVSDSHIGAELPVRDSIPQYLKELTSLIELERITHLIHLGDVIQGDFDQYEGADYVSQVVTEMNKLSVPSWVIGGNHDRDYVRTAAWRNVSQVTRIDELAIFLDISEARPPTRIFLSHDMGNNYRVRDPLAFSFISWIKDAFKTVIGPNDWYLTGHCHTTFCSLPSKLGCIGQFAPEIGAYAYTVLEIGETVSINMRVLLEAPSKTS
jgi:predicted phosphodiesterase